MKTNINYISLIDIAKINLSNKFNYKLQEYKKNQTSELKEDIIKLVQDRKKIFLFDKDIINKYL